MPLNRQQRWEAGDRIPGFTVRSTSLDKYQIDSVAGRYIILTFFGSAAIPKNMQAIRHICAKREMLDEKFAAFFGVSIDPSDEATARVAQSVPGIRFFWDFDQKISRLCGAIPENSNPDLQANEGTVYHPFTLILDPMLRVMKHIPLTSAEEHNRVFDAFMASLPPVDGYASVPTHAPVLVLPRVFEPAFCRELMALYDADGGMDSGFMREINGKTVTITDHTRKRRNDVYLGMEGKHADMCAAIRARLIARLVPEVKRAFQFEITRMERYVVSRYDSADGGFFNAHRDNTTMGTAHRQFACSINLNAEEYEGGDLRFPEFGSKTYRAPTGGAVVFSCSLLHEATTVTRGVRYAFLPFFYNEAAAALRKQNAHVLTGEVIDKNKGEDESMLSTASPSSDAGSSLP